MPLPMMADFHPTFDYGRYKHFCLVYTLALRWLQPTDKWLKKDVWMNELPFLQHRTFSDK